MNFLRFLYYSFKVCISHLFQRASDQATRFRNLLPKNPFKTFLEQWKRHHFLWIHPSTAVFNKQVLKIFTTPQIQGKAVWRKTNVVQKKWMATPQIITPQIIRLSTILKAVLNFKDFLVQIYLLGPFHTDSPVMCFWRSLFSELQSTGQKATQNGNQTIQSSCNSKF